MDTSIRVNQEQRLKLHIGHYVMMLKLESMIELTATLRVKLNPLKNSRPKNFSPLNTPRLANFLQVDYIEWNWNNTKSVSVIGD